MGVQKISYFGNFPKSQDIEGNLAYAIIISACYSIPARNLNRKFGAVFEKIWFFKNWPFLIQNYAKTTNIFKKLHMTLIKELVVGNNFYLRKNCLSSKMLFEGVQKFHFSAIFENEVARVNIPSFYAFFT